MPDDVRGLNELLQRLDRLPLALSRDVARDALEAAGEVMVRAAEASAPRRSGELADDIIMKVRVSSDFRSNSVKVGPGYPGPRPLITRKRGKYAGQPDPTSSPGIYGGFVERGHGKPGQSWVKRYGSAKQRRRSGREIEFGSGDVAPHPWLKPSFEQSQDEALEALKQVTADALRNLDRLVR